MLRIAIARNATPAHVRLPVRNQTTPATMAAGSNMKIARSSNITKTATIRRTIRIMISPVPGRIGKSTHESSMAYAFGFRVFALGCG